MSRSERGYHEQNKRCKRKLDHHMQTRGKEGEGQDVLGLAIILLLFEHPFIIYGNGDGEEVPAGV